MIKSAIIFALFLNFFQSIDGAIQKRRGGKGDLGNGLSNICGFKVEKECSNGESPKIVVGSTCSQLSSSISYPILEVPDLRSSCENNQKDDSTLMSVCYVCGEENEDGKYDFKGDEGNNYIFKFPCHAKKTLDFSEVTCMDYIITEGHDERRLDINDLDYTDLYDEYYNSPFIWTPSE